MKKYILIFILATFLMSCGNELSEVYTEYKAVSSEKKKDASFKIFNDHYQKGKGDSK